MSDNEILKIAAYYKAAALADWGQVGCNGGPPCFHIENEKFCLRAERWDGHGKADHAFVPLGTLLGRVAADSGMIQSRNACHRFRPIARCIDAT